MSLEDIWVPSPLNLYHTSARSVWAVKLGILMTHVGRFPSDGYSVESVPVADMGRRSYSGVRLRTGAFPDLQGMIEAYRTVGGSKMGV